MRLRGLISTAILAGLLSGAAKAQETPPSVRTAYENGLRALSDNLPGLAGQRFRNALAEAAVDDPLAPEIKLRLGEALVRSGDPAEAMTVLETTADGPDATKWRGYAFALAGELTKAEETFAGMGTTDEAILLTRARILAGLGKDERLTEILDQLSASENPETQTEARLLRAATHLTRGRLNEAATALGDSLPVPAAQRGLHQYLAGRIALARGKTGTAAAQLKSLLDDTEVTTRSLLHAASVTYADALHDSEEVSAAIEFLLDYLTRTPDSPIADSCLERLTDWSRSADALRELVDNRLLEWIDQPIYGFLYQRNDPIAVSVAAQSAQPPSPLAPLALLHRARHLAERNDEKSVHQAKHLLARLRMESVDPGLVARSLLDTSRLHLATGNRESALSALRALELCSPSPELRIRAAELAGVIRYESDDFAKAAAAFGRVRDYLGEDATASDDLNLGLSLLQSGATEEFGALLGALDGEQLRRSLALEKLLLQSSRLDSEARSGLDRFLRENPEHPRNAEARLALAELSLQFEPRDLTMASAQIASIDPAKLPEALALRHLLTSLLLGEATNEWESAIASGSSFLDTFPDSPLDPVVRLKMGEAYYLNNDFNRAQRLFQQLVRDEQATAYHEVALFFAARAALKVLTPESRAEAISLLQTVVEREGRLADEARLQLVRVHLDTGATEKALASLDPLLAKRKTMQERLDPLVLKAEASRALGTSKGDQQAVDILEECLAWKDLPYPESNRLHYLMALTLEQLGRELEALDTLYQVVNRENLPEGAAVTEWTYFYNCGFKAIRLLGERKDWKGAYAIARKLAASGGPRSAEADKRAKAIQLEHMIWEHE